MYVIRPIQIKLEKKSVSIPDHSDLRWQLASVRIKLMETGMTANESTPARFTTSEQVAPTGAQAAVTPVLVPHPQAPVASRGAAFHIGTATHARSELREAVARATRIPEAESLRPQLALARPGNERAARTDAIARQLINTLRTQPAQGGRAGRVQALMQEYALSTEEGVALMCLAEALLRIPDAATRDVSVWPTHLEAR